MNILHVTLGFYPAQAWGGPVRVVHQNGKELVRRGHHVTVYCTNLLDKRHKMGAETAETTIDGMRIVYFDTIRLRWWPGTLGPIWLPDLQAYLRREISSFNVIHINGYRSPMLLQVARFAKRTGIPFVTQPHGMLPIKVNSFFVKRLYDRAFGQMELRGTGALIALQDSERQYGLIHGIPADRIEVVPNGIDLQDRQRMPEPGMFRRRFGIAPDRPLILFLARISRIKGTDMLIEAFAQLKNANALLAIAGPDDGQLNEVKRLIRKYNLIGRVVLPGLLARSDALAALQDADLFVLPSRADAFPVSIMEACLVGIPMVITDRCEIAHLLRDRVADVVPFDPGAFASAMQQLLADRERYERYRSNCGAMITETFSIDAVADRLETIYARVIGKK